jgi:hypothetical protein
VTSLWGTHDDLRRNSSLTQTGAPRRHAG